MERRAERPPPRIRQPDGTLAPFDSQRISRSVARAAAGVQCADPDLPSKVTAGVIADLAAADDRVPTVEDIRSAVEARLTASGHGDVARAYARDRRRWTGPQTAKHRPGVRDELGLSPGAVAILAERYLLRDRSGNVAESTGEMMDRVARQVAAGEDSFACHDAQRWEEAFAGLLRRLEFLPNSPTLMNAGTPLGMLSGCFVLPLEDSLESIFSTLGQAALIHQAGGGTGFAFSALRPRGDAIRATGGVASGPVSFLRLFDTAADVIREAGRRRGANMGVLDVSHPDIEEFAAAKESPGALSNFNLSVGITDRFMRAVIDDEDHRLINPRTKRSVRTVPARLLFERFAEAAWRCGDPGLLFLDAINRGDPLPDDGPIRATNPCGEVPLRPNESCNLGSINLTRFIVDGRVDEQALRATVRVAVRFLDDVIEVNRYPAPQLAAAARRTRKVGLGMMGLAEALAAAGIRYGSEQAATLAGHLAAVIRHEARRASTALAVERGPFPAFTESRYAADMSAPFRNAQLTSVAPTGTISLIAGTTSGIEPLFAIAYQRLVGDRRLVEVNPLFESIAHVRGFYSEELLAELAHTGTAAHPAVPEDVRRSFVTALELAPEDHLRMQAAVQRHTDAAVSKTVNLPATATKDDVRRLYLQAWQAGVKGITIYRYGSRPQQVLRLLSAEATIPAPPVLVDASYTGGCPTPACHF